jgi:hypothetical protein
MALDSEKLKNILNKGDVEAVVNFFAGASEKERLSVAPVAVEWCRFIEAHWQGQFNKKVWAEVEAKGPITNWHNFAPAAFAAALACGDFKFINSVGNGYGVKYLEVEPLQAILSDRRPPWIGDFAEHLCDHELGRWAGDWKKVRALVRAGLCKPPKHNNYVLEAIEGIRPRFQRDKPQPRLLDLLLNERDWLATDFWRLFEIDGTGEVSLANNDKYGSCDSWSAALVELSRRGIISRERLLDASLAALSRDFIQFRAGWFSRFHELLEPTPSERFARLDTYLQLIGSSIPPTVAFAVNAVVIIDKNNPLGAKTLISNLQPALHARGKAVVKESVKLLAAAAKREPKARKEICLAAIPALLNEAPDVQKAVLDLLDVHADKSDADLKSKLQEHSGAIAASLKPRLASWLGKTACKAASAPTTIAKQKLISRLDPSRALDPITNLDDLIHLASAVLEDPSNPHDIERVLGGVSHLCNQRPDDFASRTGPLRQRALKKRGQDLPVWNRPPAHERALAMFLLTWIDASDAFIETAEELARGQNHYAFLFRRLIAVARQVQTGCALPMLSLPTHLDGWIDARALVERWLAWQKAAVDPDIHEQVLALLRIAPENRNAALSSAKKLAGECGQAVRYALGAKEIIGKTAALWLAASRSRQPHGDLPEFEAKHPHLGPDAGFAAKYTWGLNDEFHNLRTSAWTMLDIVVRVEPSVPKNIPDAYLPVLFHSDSRASGEFRPLIRWASLLWPANHESVFAYGARRLGTAVNYADANDREFAGYVDALLNPHTEFLPMACLTLALALAAEATALRGLAQDALIAAISENRFDAAALGQPMAALLNTGLNKLARWSKSLREVSRLSPQHARACVELLTQTLKGDPQKAPRDTGALLELLYELLNETNSSLTDLATREYISSLPTGGKTAKLAKQLLAQRVQA